jgi:RecA-family ATPase
METDIEENNEKHEESVSSDYDGFKITTCKDILNSVVEPEYFIVDPLIPEQAITSITADSGKGKSLLALIIGYHLASGKSLFNQYTVKQSKVLIIDQEMNPNQINSRFKKIIDSEIDIDYIIDQRFNITDEYDYSKLWNDILMKNYKVVIFDTFTEIHNKEENDSGAMKEVNNALLKLIRLTGVTIIYLHHHRKMQKGERLSQSSSRGSSEIIAKVSSHLLIESKSYKEEESSVLEMTISQEKARSSKRLDVKITIKIINNNVTNKITWEYLGEVNDKAKKVEEAKDAILEILNSGQAGLTVNDAENKIPNVGKSNIRVAFKELVEGKILDVGLSGREKYYTTNSDFAC